VKLAFHWSDVSRYLESFRLLAPSHSSFVKYFIAIQYERFTIFVNGAVSARLSTISQKIQAWSIGLSVPRTFLDLIQRFAELFRSISCHIRKTEVVFERSRGTATT